MPNGYGYPSAYVGYTDVGPSYTTPSGLGYIPDTQLPSQLQPTAYIPTLPAIESQTYTTPSGLPYVPDVSLPQILQPVTPSGIPYIPDVSLPAGLEPTEPIPVTGYGPLEFVGDVASGAWNIVSGAAEAIYKAGQAILENLEVGIGVASKIGGAVSGITAQQRAAEAAELQAEAQKIAAQAYALQTLAAQQRGVTPTTAAAAAQPLAYITPETGEGTNYLLYIGLAILAIILFGKK